jgi:putative membrane protein
MHKMIVGAVAAAGAAPALVAGSALAQAPATPETYPYGRMMWWGGGWEGMFFGPLFMVLVIAAVVGIVLLLVRRPGGSWQGTTSPPQGRTALDILKDRYARGEIDKADYEERRRVLGE